MQPHTDPPTLEIRSADKKRVRRAQGESNFESLLDVAEAAKLLRIHPKTLRNKARRGIIPGVQVGRLWRFRASALNEWLDEIAS
jgi:excisionase family DNA binding protein